ncbi:gamma-glutamylcyclotransferase family protein [Paenibacillus thalictri]|nr:gamma-glutamylcyclotransferase family protein [Paenibacillus thalictri]
MKMFVYGTLLSGEANHDVVAPYLISVETGAVRGKLYDAGEYPALVLHPEGSRIVGEWLTIDPAALPTIDAFEDYHGPNRPNEYERVWVRDESRDALEGWIYVYSDSHGLKEILGGSWRGYRSGNKTKKA